MNCCMSPRQRSHVSAVPVHGLKIVHAGKVREKHFIKLKGVYTLQSASYRITHRDEVCSPAAVYRKQLLVQSTVQSLFTVSQSG